MTIRTSRLTSWDIVRTTSNTSLDDSLVRMVTGRIRHKEIRTRRATIKSMGMEIMGGKGPQQIWLSELVREHLQG